MVARVGRVLGIEFDTEDAGARVGYVTGISFTVPVPSPAPAPATRRGGDDAPRRRRPAKVAIEIDGQTYTVEGEQEAFSLLDRLKREAIAKAKMEAEAALAVAKEKESATGKLPVLEVDVPDLEQAFSKPRLRKLVGQALPETQKEIDRAYLQAAMEAERVWRKYEPIRRDDEEVLALLLQDY